MVTQKLNYYSVYRNEFDIRRALQSSCQLRSNFIISGAQLLTHGPQSADSLRLAHDRQRSVQIRYYNMLCILFVYLLVLGGACRQFQAGTHYTELQ